MKVLLKIFAFTAIFLLSVSAEAQWKDTAQRTQLREVQFRRDTTTGWLGTGVRNYEENIGRQNAMFIETPYVLKVRILDVAIGLDSTFNKGKHPNENVNVLCEVLDTFKGRKIPYNCYYPKQQNRKEREAFQKKNQIQNCLKFSFSPRQYTGYIQPNLQCLPSGVTWRMREVQPGEEYYLFLRHMAINDSMDILIPLSHYEKAGGFFKINDGKVEDEENFWGLGEFPAEEVFKKLLKEKAAIKWPEVWDTAAWEKLK